MARLDDVDEAFVPGELGVRRRRAPGPLSDAGGHEADPPGVAAIVIAGQGEGVSGGAVDERAIQENLERVGATRIGRQ
ncbi:MAG: hypothetical protein OTJ97_09820 [SAR202 cluster bacterium]|nr:hypothetical protein [SAR202 cluster bacterium]